MPLNLTLLRGDLATLIPEPPPIPLPLPGTVQIVTGPGLDNIDYVARRRELFAAASRAATLTVARVDAHGTVTAVAVVPTAPGARNAVATEEGTAFLTDSPEGKILVVSPATNR